jgi:hypothetical protein
LVPVPVTAGAEAGAAPAGVAAALPVWARAATEITKAMARSTRVNLLVIGSLELLGIVSGNFLACLLLPRPTLGHATKVDRVLNGHSTRNRAGWLLFPVPHTTPDMRGKRTPTFCILRVESVHYSIGRQTETRAATNLGTSLERGRDRKAERLARLSQCEA